MDYTVMDQYWIWLSAVPGITVKKFYQLISEYEDPREVWQRVGMGASCFSHLGEQVARGLTEARNERQLFALFANLDKLGIRAVTRLSDDYPSLLTEIFDPPPVLYVKGTADLNADKGFSIVGTRRPTHDGKRAATDIAEGLSKHGVAVVSGLARGIDTCSHVGALKSQAGKTIAVLGSGVDVIYPPENAGIAQQIVDTGGALISEFPPGTLPLPQHFPQRNRVIAGLTRGTLVVEGAKGSGAMITANMALDSGRDVFVVPGSIYSSLSYEPNRMLLQGAYPVLSEWEILEHYGWAQREESGAQAPKIELTEEETSIVEPLRAEALSFGEIQTNTGLSSAKLNSLLTMLELRGIIDKVPGSLYRAR